MIVLNHDKNYTHRGDATDKKILKKDNVQIGTAGDEKIMLKDNDFYEKYFGPTIMSILNESNTDKGTK